MLLFASGFVLPEFRCFVFLIPALGILPAFPLLAPTFTATEYRPLHALSLDAGGATTFEALQRRVRGPVKGDRRAVRRAVTKLRRKLGDDARTPRCLLGKRGMGYRMPEPDNL